MAPTLFTCDDEDDDHGLALPVDLVGDDLVAARRVVADCPEQAISLDESSPERDVTPV
jgi:ferredoxin